MCSRLVLVIVFVTATPVLHSAELYVAPHGSDMAVGSRQDPYRTVARARQDISAGDSVLLLDGRYPAAVELNGIHGSKDAPVTIGAAPDAKVVFDGTDELAGSWKRVTPDSPEGRLIQPACGFW